MIFDPNELCCTEMRSKETRGVRRLLLQPPHPLCCFLWTLKSPPPPLENIDPLSSQLRLYEFWDFNLIFFTVQRNTNCGLKYCFYNKMKITNSDTFTCGLLFEI